MQTTVIWLSLFVLFLVIEIITMGLTTIWFAGGALVAFLVAVLGLGLGVQIIIFAIVSLALHLLVLKKQTVWSVFPSVIHFPIAKSVLNSSCLQIL